MDQLPALDELLELTVCAVRPTGGAIAGTGWRVQASGTILTAGHLFPGGATGPDAPSRAQVTFGAGDPLPVDVTFQAHDRGRGIDVAVLTAPEGGAGPVLPISLERAPRGAITSMGYGRTLVDISSGGGQIVGSFNPGNDPANRMLRCRSDELADSGYSGAPIVARDSEEAVVAIQSEAAIGGRGAPGTVVAMPLYRVARLWPRLAEIEAAQVTRRDMDGRDLVLVIAPPGSRLVASLASHAAAHDVRIEVVKPGARDLPERVVLDLADTTALLLVAEAHMAGDGWAELAVTSAAVRQIPVVIAQPADAAASELVSGLPRLDVRAGDEDMAAERLLDLLARSSAPAARTDQMNKLAEALPELPLAATQPRRLAAVARELRQPRDVAWLVQAQSAEATAPKADPGAADTLARTVGVRPFYPEHHFRDRTEEARRISAFLADPMVGLVVLTGRPGIGKSALLAHLVEHLRHQRWFHDGSGPHIDGIAFATASGGPRAMANEIVLQLARLSETADLVRIWADERVPVDERARRLVEAIGERVIVVVVDDDAGVFDSDDELSGLVTAFVCSDNGVTFLMAGPAALNVPAELLNRARTVPMHYGLPDDDAMQVLRELDPQDQFGLGSAQDATLRTIAQRVHGLPRGLQLAVGLLANDPLLTVDDLTSDEALLDLTLQELIAKTHGRLDDVAATALLALAVLGRPAPIAAPIFLSGPFVDGADIRSAIGRLVQSQLASVDAITRTVALHPADRDYQLATAAASKPGTLVVLHRRAAEYYLATGKTPAEMATFEEVQPVLFAVAHLLDAGDVRAATEALDAVDGLLELWGHYRIVTELRERIARDAEFEDPNNAMRLGRLFWLMGDALTAATWLNRADTAAAGSPEHAAILVDLAAAQRDSGAVRGSLSMLRAALKLAGQQRDRDVAARCLVQSSHTLRPLGFPELALRCTDRALALLDETPEPPTPTADHLRGSALLNGMISLRLLGRTTAATVKLDQCRPLVEALKDPGLRSYVDCCSAGLHRDVGRPDQALDDLVRAKATYEEIGDQWGLAAASATVCWSLVDMMDVGAARHELAAEPPAPGCNPRARGSRAIAEGVLARRIGDLAGATALLAGARDDLRRAEMDLYAETARAELAFTELLGGQASSASLAARLGGRQLPAPRAWGAVLVALAACRDDTRDAEVRVANAGAAVEALPAEEGTLAMALLNGALAALSLARSSDDAAQAALQASIIRPWTEFPHAPGPLADYRALVAAIAATSLPCADAVAGALATAPPTPPNDRR